jgi:hypothetical protein
MALLAGNINQDYDFFNWITYIVHSGFGVERLLLGFEVALRSIFPDHTFLLGLLTLMLVYQGFGCLVHRSQQIAFSE